MLARADDSLLDAGPRTRRRRERMCAATRTVRPITEMIRFVVGPDGAVVPDLRERLPGRGLWVTATREALARAVKRKAFGAGFRREVRADAGLIATTEDLLARAALDALSICAKAGQVVTGFTRVEAALACEPVVALIHAAGAAPDGIRKLDAALWRQRGAQAAAVAIVNEFSSEQLDLALGRPNVVHAALLNGPASDTFLARHARLIRFRTGDAADLRDAPARPAMAENKERNV